MNCCLAFTLVSTTKVTPSLMSRHIIQSSLYQVTMNLVHTICPDVSF